MNVFLVSHHIEPEAHTGLSTDEIFKMYEIVRDYDVHYSTVRSAISTFLITAVFAIDAWIVATTGDRHLMWIEHRVVWSSLVGPVALVLMTMWISAHFERLTVCCQKIEQNLEAHLAHRRGGPQPSGWSAHAPVLFREGIKYLTARSTPKNERVRFDPLFADVPQRSLLVFAVLQVIASLWYWRPVLADLL